MRKFFILALALTLLAAVGSGCASQTVAPSETSEPTLGATVAITTSTVATTIASTTAATEATTVPTVSDFANKEVTLDNVEAALSGFFMEGEYIGTDVENSGGTVYITITYRPSNILDENDFAVKMGHQAAMVMNVLFSNAGVDVVTLKGDTATVEDAMEISMSKETAETVDWTALINDAQTDYKATLNAADSYYMDSSISDKLK